MKYMVLAGALAFSLCAGVCEAEDGKAQGSSGQTAVAESTGSGSGLKHIDLGDNVEQNVDRVGVMEPGQSYDENTGMPDVVNSDGDMNLN